MTTYDPRSIVAPGGATERALKLERAMVRVRWVGIALGVFQIALYTPPRGAIEPGYARPAAFALLASLLVLNIVDLVMLRRDLNENQLRRLGHLNFVWDIAFLFGMVWVFNYEEFGTTWVILYVATLEGALRHQRGGAMLPVGVAAVLEPLRAVFRQEVFGYPFEITGVTFVVGIMGIIGLVAGVMAGNLSREREAAERRAFLVATVASVGRRSTLDPDEVLSTVVDSCRHLGFEAGAIALFDEAWRTYRLVHGRNLPDEFLRTTHPITEGLVGQVHEERRTLTVSNYGSFSGAIPQLRGAGFRAVVASPVWSGGTLVAVLAAGTRTERRLEPEEVEAIELLAAQAGRALENAQRFGDERRTVERLAELDRMKRDFLSMVSHEIRTPLTAIEGLGITLQDSWNALEEGERRELLARMNANSATLHGIITSLLDFSQLEAGSLKAKIERVDLHDLLLAVAGRLETLLSDHVFSLHADRGLEVMGDPFLLDRVVENLVSNAAKHTPGGTRIELAARSDTTVAEISVTDSGPGMSQDDLEHIGQKFYRGGDPNARPTKGIGLGLALVREILELHGSSLVVESSLGEGSRFTFRLPVAIALDRERVGRA
jgi:signal transduction histidine kinase